MSQKRKMLKQADSSDLKLYQSPKWVTRSQHERHHCNHQNSRKHHPIAQSCSKGLVYCITQNRLYFDHSFLINTAKQHSNLLLPISEYIRLVKIQERSGQLIFLSENEDLSYTFKWLPLCQTMKTGTARSKAVCLHQVFNSNNAAVGMKLQIKPQALATSNMKPQDCADA